MKAFLFVAIALGLVGATLGTAAWGMHNAPASMLWVYVAGGSFAFVMIGATMGMWADAEAKRHGSD